MDRLSLIDLFLVGLFLDFTGAFLLAKGLLLSAREIAKLNTWDGIAKGSERDRCRNKVDGIFGVTYLLAGFILQALGYALEISGVPSRTSWTRLLAALLLAGIASLIAWSSWATMRSSLIRRLQGKVDRERPAAALEIEDAEKRAAST